MLLPTTAAALELIEAWRSENDRGRLNDMQPVAIDGSAVTDDSGMAVECAASQQRGSTSSSESKI